MPALQVMPQALEAQYRETLNLYLAAVRHAEEAGQLNDGKVFSSVLAWGLNQLGLSAAELAQDEDINKGTVSKWLNNQVVPSAPTRKTVVNWIKQKAEERLSALTP